MIKSVTSVAKKGRIKLVSMPPGEYANIRSDDDVACWLIEWKYPNGKVSFPDGRVIISPIHTRSDVYYYYQLDGKLLTEKDAYDYIRDKYSFSDRCTRDFMSELNNL